MNGEKTVLSTKQRDALFSRISEDANFREMLKKDWRAAFKEALIDPDSVVNGTLSREEINNFQQRFGWTIIIVIFEAMSGRNKIEMKDAINFESRV